MPRPPPPPEPESDDVSHAWDALDKDAIEKDMRDKKDKAIESYDLAKTQFVAVPHGAKSNIGKKGMAIDSWRAKALDASGNKFLKRYGFHESATFYFSAYPEYHCEVLARAWADKWEYLYRIALAHEPEVHVFTSDEIDSYVEPDDLQILVADLDPAAAIFRRVRQFLNLDPEPPVAD